MIKNRELKLDYNDDLTSVVFDGILWYIYNYYDLNHSAMMKYYNHVKAPKDYEYMDGFQFQPNDKKDSRYFYYRNKHPYDEGHDPSYIDLQDNYPNLIGQIDDFLSKKSTKSLKLCGVNDIVLINGTSDCVNKNCRGIMKADWKLHTWPKFKIFNNNGITFDDLIVACYKIKSHKFENNYEMYVGISSVKLNDHRLEIVVDFDHSS